MTWPPRREGLETSEEYLWRRYYEREAEMEADAMRDLKPETEPIDWVQVWMSAIFLLLCLAWALR